MTITASRLFRLALPVLLSALGGQESLAGPLRERLQERQAERFTQEAPSERPTALAARTRVLRNIAYGSAERQRFDAYLPVRPKAAPIILMVHGGGWARGDKAMGAVVDNKVARWVPRGFILVSTNYRLLPEADPVEQARDIARALAAVQSQASSWGGDPSKVILMGHSAGAHLVALLATDHSLSHEVVTTPWLGTIALDSATLDVESTMQGDHMDLHDRAFGSDPAFWKAASPYHALTAATRPVLAVCSIRREEACAQALRFTEKAVSLGVRAQTLKKDLSHRQINETLGEDGGYTAEVEAFMASLDPSIARLLGLSP